MHFFPVSSGDWVGMLRWLALAIVLTLLCGCGAERAAVEDLDRPRLYLWLAGADDHIPPSVPSRATVQEQPSSHRLAEAVVQCGGSAFEIDGEPLSGEEVSMPSTGDDERMIECVRSRVGFGFNASRFTRRLWSNGQRGPLVER
jgi:hypothetical protein